MARQHSSEDDGSATASDHATVEVLWAATDALIDPCVLLEAMRDASGEIVDFCYRHVNQATCDCFGVSRAYLIGSGMLDTTPGIKESLLADFIRCLETGEPLISTTSPTTRVLQDTRRYDLQATRATGDYIVLTWRDVTERLKPNNASQRPKRVTARPSRAPPSVWPCSARMVASRGSTTPCAFFGYDPATLLHMTWQELTAPEDPRHQRAERPRNPVRAGGHLPDDQAVPSR
ncbi:MAG: PAS domain-containing protein [Mycolicibacterium sp.]|nr:PAS domain-containing protein [Mycolicibacterium sp.]